MEIVKEFSKFNDDTKYLNVHIGDNHLQCERCVVNSEGLIGRKIKKDGMAFIFKSNQPMSFHTKGCIIPIDIVFILRSKIVKIYHNCQPNSPDNFECKLAFTVLEFPAGTCERLSIKEGDLVKFHN